MWPLAIPLECERRARPRWFAGGACRTGRRQRSLPPAGESIKSNKEQEEQSYLISMMHLLYRPAAKPNSAGNSPLRGPRSTAKVGRYGFKFSAIQVCHRRRKSQCLLRWQGGQPHNFPAHNSRKTLGLIYPGKFHFSTDAAERMEIVAGECHVKLEGHRRGEGRRSVADRLMINGSWRRSAEPYLTYGPGQHFEVPAKSGFDVEVNDFYLRIRLLIPPISILYAQLIHRVPFLGALGGNGPSRAFLLPSRPQ